MPMNLPQPLQSSVKTFTDPDEYIAHTRSVGSRIILTGYGPLRAELTRIQLHRLWLQRGVFPLEAIYCAASPPDRISLIFNTTSSVVRDGCEATPDDLMIWLPSRRSYAHAKQFSYGTLSLPISDVETIRTLTGQEIATTSQIRPTSHALSRLRLIHHNAAELAKHSPDELAHPEIAKSIEDAAMSAIADCMAIPEPPYDPAYHTRMRIIQQFEEILDENEYRPVYLTQVCMTLGVSERTLRRHCNDQFGMGPRHFLTYRRLNLVQRALSRADPTTNKVATIAKEFGFTQLGRFSKVYQALFKELPSSTLGRICLAVFVYVLAACEY